MSFIAPQAYTKETLVKAFDWLQHQPASLKQVATSPDVLVGLFLKAQRQGITNIDADAPVSSKKFIDDLKSLKKDFAQFDDVAKTPATNFAQQSNASYSASKTASYTAESQSAEHSASHTVAHTSSHSVAQGASASPGPSTFQNAPVFAQTIHSPTYNTTVQHGALPLDEHSLAMLTAIQQRFNLSTPQEALRMLIAVGYQQISRWQ